MITHKNCFSRVLALFAAAFMANVNGEEPSKPRLNVVFVLCDDHRFDCLGAAGHPFLQTPHLDQLSRDGAMLTRAYVTTSLCSPSRASILTGLYAHNHRVVDNYHPVDPELEMFPLRLQQSGYETAFIGKWHMGGDIDDPQRGFDHWVAFKGQGTYRPDGHGTTREVPQTNYDGLYNLIDAPPHAARVDAMNGRLWQLLGDSNGLEMPLLEDRGQRFPWRHPEATPQAPIPEEHLRRSEQPE